MHRAVRIICFALALFATTVVAADTITVSTDNTPLYRATLEVLSREAFGRIGHDFRLVSQPSARSLHSANSGRVDGEGLRVAGLERQYPNLRAVPEPFADIQFVAFGVDPSLRLDDGWASLAPYRVAFINGWKLFEQKATGARQVTKVDAPGQLFQMLEAGRVDLALYTLADGLALVREMGLANVVAVGPPLRQAEMYLYLHRTRSGLLDPLAEALREMKRDGTHARLLRELGRE